MRVLKGHSWSGLCKSVLSMHSSQQRKIEEEFSNEDERKTAAVNFYVHKYPYASWRNIIRKLDFWGDHHTIHHYAETLTGMLLSS